MEELVKLLRENKKTISFMESCTGGAVSNKITDIPNASEVFMFSAITYSNEFKIKMGVDKKIIDKYSVYSFPVAHDMAFKIAQYTKSDYGVGITGKLKKKDNNNLFGEDDVVYLTIYDCANDTYIDEKIKLLYNTRKENKDQIINILVEKMLNLIK